MRAFQLSIPEYNYMDHVINLKWEIHLKSTDIVALKVGTPTLDYRPYTITGCYIVYRVVHTVWGDTV